MTEVVKHPGRAAANAAWLRDGKKSPLAGLGAALRRSKNPAPRTPQSTRDARYTEALIARERAWGNQHRKPKPPRAHAPGRYWPHQSLRETSRHQWQIETGVLRWPTVWTAKVSPAELHAAITSGKVL